MTTLKRIVLIHLLCLLPGLTFAQGAYLKDGHNGIGIGIHHLVTDGNNATGVEIGFAIKATADFGFSYSRASLDFGSSSGTESIYSGMFAIHLMSKSESPIKLSLETSISSSEAGGGGAVYTILPYIHLDIPQQGRNKLKFLAVVGRIGTMASRLEGEYIGSLGITYYHSTLANDVLLVGLQYSKVTDHPSTIGFSIGWVFSSYYPDF